MAVVPSTLKNERYEQRTEDGMEGLAEFSEPPDYYSANPKKQIASEFEATPQFLKNFYHRPFHAVFSCGSYILS
jgi:hypothetical protein